VFFRFPYVEKTVCLLSFTCKSLPRCQAVAIDHPLKDAQTYKYTSTKVKKHQHVYYIDRWYTRALHPSVQSMLHVTLNCSQRVRCYMKVFTASEMLHESVHSVWDVTWKRSEGSTQSVFDVTWKCSEGSTQSVFDVTWKCSEGSTQSVFDITWKRSERNTKSLLNVSWKCSERSTKSVLDVTRMCWRVLHVSQDHRTLLHAPPKPPCSGGRM